MLEKTTLTNLGKTKNGFHEGEAKNSESEWVDDKYHGHGTYKWAAGFVYERTWIGDKKLTIYF